MVDLREGKDRPPVPLRSVLYALLLRCASPLLCFLLSLSPFPLFALFLSCASLCTISPTLDVLLYLSL